MAYQMMKGKKGNNDGFPSIPGMIARYSALGLTNEQMAANPVWVDKTGNGHDLQMKNFAWKGMSGVGGVSTYYDKYEFTPDKYYMVAVSSGTQHAKFTFKVTGLVDGNILSLADTSSPSNVYGKWTQDGIYTVDIDVINTDRSLYFYNGVSATRGEFTIEIFPLYPGALVFDGVDDYGVCDNFPILTKEKGYTVVALRQWITRGERALGLVSNVKNWLNNGAFLLEYRNIQADHLNKPISFGAIGSEMDLPHILTYQTSKSYNGVSITTGNFEGTDVLHVGKLAPTNVGTCINAAIWELVFLDHDATEEELTKIKDYFVKTYPWLFPYQAWTVVGKTNEDEDRATIANITGNGNDLILSNFGFAEGSGYGLYKLNFNNWFANSGSGNVNIVNVVNPHKIVLEQSQEAVGAFFLGKNVSYTGELKISVSNKPSDIELSFGSTALGKVILNEGINIVKINPVNTSIGFFTNKAFEAQNIIIEQIPECEGYLMTDGVDDKAVSKQFKIGENFTVILDFKFPVKKISYCGFDLSSKVRIQNLQGSGVYVVLKGNKILIPSNVVRAVTSEGKVYDENWNEYNIVPGNISSNYTMVNLGFDGSNQFAESATKLAGIYSSTLFKDDCIKAYNYLQTLKAK
jgi:hypothetical protein